MSRSDYYTSTRLFNPTVVASDGSVHAALQATIDAAAPNTRIMLPDGIFRLKEPPRLRSHKQLVGPGPHRCTLLMDNPYSSAFLVDDGAEDWLLQGVTIDGSRLPGQTQAPVAGLHTFSSRRGTIRDVQVRNTGGNGIEAGDTDDLLIEDCVVDNIGLHGIWLGWAGENRTHRFARGTMVRRTKVTNVALDAVEVHRDTIFEDCTVERHGVNYVSADPIATAGGFYVMECPTGVGGINAPAHDVTFTRCRALFGRGAGWDISDNATRIMLDDVQALHNGGCGFSIAGNHCMLTRFWAFGNGGTPTSPLRAGVVLGSQQGGRACHSNLIRDGVIEYNMNSAIYIAARNTFPPYGSSPVNNRILDIQMYGNAGLIINSDPSAPNIIRP